MPDFFDRLASELGRAADAPQPSSGRTGARATLLHGWRRGRRRHWGTRLVVVATFVCVPGALGGMALAGTLGGTAITPQQWVDGQRVDPEAGPTPDQTASLAILRRPRVASDTLPASDSSLLTGTPAAANGANVALSRRAEGFGASGAWLIPGDGMICFIYDNPPVGAGGGCGSDASFSSGQQVMISGGGTNVPGLTSVVGVVPDGVTTVTVNVVGAGSHAVPVHENVYMTSIEGQLASVVFAGPNGPVTVGG